MQSQWNFSDKITTYAPAGGHTAGVPTEIGSLIGIPFADVAEGERSTSMVRGVHGTTAVIASEVWTAGQPIYWHETAKVFTISATHWPVGWVAEDKAAAATYGVVALDRPLRTDGEILAPFDFTATPTLGEVGSYTLRDFGRNMLLLSVEILEPVDLAGGAGATIALTDGAAVTVLSATDITTIDAYADVTPVDAGPPVEPNAIVDKLVLEIGTADITAGQLIVRVTAAPAP